MAPLEAGFLGSEVTTDLEIGGKRLRLVRPADPDRLLNDPTVLARNARDDYMPYWAYLWPGAFLLAEAVAGASWIPGTRALELGCGLGLAGLAGVGAGLHVTFSDYEPAPFPYLARSALANGFTTDRYVVEPLDWTDPPDRTYPLILGADVLYERRLIPLVVSVLARMLDREGVAWVAGPYRVATEDLPMALARAGLVDDPSAVEARGERGEALRGTLHRIRREGGPG